MLISTVVPSLFFTFFCSYLCFTLAKTYRTTHQLFLMYKKPIINLRQFIQQRSESQNYYTVKYIRCVTYYMAISCWLAVLSARRANYYQTHYIKHIIYNQQHHYFIFQQINYALTIKQIIIIINAIPNIIRIFVSFL